MASYFSHPFSFPSMPLSYMIILFFILLTMISSVNSFDYHSCCANQFNCGKLRNVSFPFSGDDSPEGCGYPGMHLDCSANLPYTTIKNVSYLVKEVHLEKHTLRIARAEYLKGLCPSQFSSSTFNALYQSQITDHDVLDHNLFDYVPGYHNVTLFYGCNVEFAWNVPGHFDCPVNGIADTSAHPLLGALPPTWYCKFSVVVPVPSTFTDLNFQNLLALGEAIIDGFEVKWMAGVEECDECQQSGGVCGYDYNLNKITCYREGSDAGSRICPPPPPQEGSPKKNQRFIIVIGLSAGGSALVMISAMIICYRMKCFRNTIKKKVTFQNHNVQKFMKSYGSLAPRRYSYSEVKKMTNLFANKLGQGGYGIVYKASLPPDGRLVAVKLLSESKGDGEEFINEVASIGRTSHVNIVSLLGFCYERNKRALIYELMSNGSLDKFIYKRGSRDAICNLEWKTLYQVAIGIARGLEYLHQRCNTRILHLDIKPQNILLDEDFCPKISDFGLVKICQKKESSVSLIGTRGTAGFIAPEVFSRTFGGVSHKSDVYSYGMLVLEMVGGRKNFDNGASHTSEVYFPDWIYKDLEQGNLSRNMSITDDKNETVRKMILVSLWCIQTKPSDRPSMGKAVEMLEGPLESLPFPPKPFLSSPPRSPLQISDLSSTNMQDINSRSTQKGGSLEQSKDFNL